VRGAEGVTSVPPRGSGQARSDDDASRVVIVASFAQFPAAFGVLEHILITLCHLNTDCDVSWRSGTTTNA
jgi:hypothetical protein